MDIALYLFTLKAICHCSGSNSHKAFLRFFTVCPYPCYPEKLHQPSLPSRCLSLFSRPLMMMLYSTDSAKPLWWLFFQQCRISSYPVSCCLTNYLSTPGPVALSKMCHMMLLCDCQCFFPFSPCLHWGCNCPGRFWIPRQQRSQPEHFDYLHLNPLPIKPLQIQPTFLLLLLIFGERPQRETPSWKGL